MSSHSHPIILASGSPRRRELLASLNIPFEVIKPEVDEEAFDLSHLSPAEFVKFLSRTKAQEVFKHHPQAIVIGVDTTVVLNGQIYGKPKDTHDAFNMLHTLQGNTHTVYTGITVFHPQDRSDYPPFASEAMATDVTMRPLSDAEVWAYIETQEPMDKAGAYAIQGIGSTLIERIDGCYFNVVGMSLYGLDQLFRQLGEELSFHNPKCSERA